MAEGLSENFVGALISPIAGYLSDSESGLVYLSLNSRLRR